MNTKNHWGWAILLLFSLALAGCAAGGKDGAAAAVEDYLTAMVSKDGDHLAALSCAEWETQAILDMDSFEAVAPRLEGVSCAESGSDGDRTLVTCAGRIITTYDNEETELELSRWTYEVVQQGGDWLVCGYK
ncbi:MAG: hypothetical protein AB1453_00260 [Chloroflexota bacterium]